MATTANGLVVGELTDAANIPGLDLLLANSVDTRYGPAVADYSDLAGISSPFAGMRVWVTGIDWAYTYNGTSWVFAAPKTAEVQTITSNSASTSGTSELTLVTSAATAFDGGTQADISFRWYNTAHTVNTDVFVVRIYEDSTQLNQWLLNIGTNGGSGNFEHTHIPAAGSHTYTYRLVRTSGSGTAVMAGTSTIPMQLVVRQSAPA